MRYAIIADIHGNLEALEAVLKDIQGQAVGKTFCLGDIVGYGADPQECMKRVRAVADLVVMGNHDAAVSGKLGLQYFNSYARDALVWTSGMVSAADLKYLGELPLMEKVDGFVVVHSSLYRPEVFPYLLTAVDAQLCFHLMDKDERVCFIGHSHVPFAFSLDEKEIGVSREAEVTLEDGTRYIVNVGSVGQPRDRDSRASYAVYDSEAASVETRRIGYDVVAAAEKIRKAGLPELLAERLFEGM